MNMTKKKFIKYNCTTTQQTKRKHKVCLGSELWERCFLFFNLLNSVFLQDISKKQKIFLFAFYLKKKCSGIIIFFSYLFRFDFVKIWSSYVNTYNKSSQIPIVLVSNHLSNGGHCAFTHEQCFLLFLSENKYLYFFLKR